MPHVPLLDAADLPAEYRYLFEENELGVLDLFRALGNNPPLLQSYMRWGTALWRESGLDGRQVELVILAVAGALESAYEWHQHVGPGREAGLSDTELAALRDGAFDELEPADRALAAYAVASIEGAVDEPTRRAVAERVDDRTLVGLTLLANHYHLTARVVESLGLEPEGEFVGWEVDSE